MILLHESIHARRLLANHGHFLNGPQRIAKFRKKLLALHHLLYLHSRMISTPLWPKYYLVRSPLPVTRNPRRFSQRQRSCIRQARMHPTPRTQACPGATLNQEWCVTSVIEFIEYLIMCIGPEQDAESVATQLCCPLFGSYIGVRGTARAVA